MTYIIVFSSITQEIYINKIIYNEKDINRDFHSDIASVNH